MLMWWRSASIPTERSFVATAQEVILIYTESREAGLQFTAISLVLV